MEKPRAPRQLRKVAWIFLITGIGSAVGMVYRSFSELGLHSFDFGVLGIFIFFGLLNYRRGWRTLALIELWLLLFTLPILFIVSLWGLYAVIPNVGMYLFITFVYIIIPFMLTLWMYRVLTKPWIRSLFYADSQSGAQTNQ
ncbi:MAG: hypothetical protein ABIP97_08000 [Chthoniobacterales bacterium]